MEHDGKTGGSRAALRKTMWLCCALILGACHELSTKSEGTDDGERCATNGGCRGSCSCSDGEVCMLDGRCVSVEQCTETCESLQASCGSVCNEHCGSCTHGKTCSLGACVALKNCTDCELALTIVEDSLLRQDYDEVVVAIDFFAPDGAPQARLAEFVLQVDGSAELIEARPGDDLVRAGKDLYRDSFTGRAFKRNADGTYRLLAYGTTRASTIFSGRLAELRLRMTDSGPITIRLQRKEHTFAPASADAWIQTSSYDLPLTVKP